MISCLGKIEINNGVRIKTNDDICLYYQWLIKKYFYNLVKIQTPSHGGHCTLYNPKIHGEKNVNEILKYNGQEIEFDLYPESLYISKVNYWIPVKCPFGDYLKKEMKIDDGPNYWGLHLTVCNKKNL